MSLTVMGCVLWLLWPIQLPATIAEQRDRLPPAVPCGDDAAGIWMAHIHYAHVHQWYIFTLDIWRDGDEGQLTGTIHSHYWTGQAQDEEPPACSTGVYRKSVIENARGFIESTTITFNAIDWAPDEPTCGEPERSYLFDYFSGEIDPERQEFQSVLNADAPEWTDIPTVFRRVACEQTAAAERAEVDAPPFVPEVRSGCDCGGCGP